MTTAINILFDFLLYCVGLVVRISTVSISLTKHSPQIIALAIFAFALFFPDLANSLFLWAFGIS